MSSECNNYITPTYTFGLRFMKKHQFVFIHFFNCVEINIRNELRFKFENYVHSFLRITYLITFK